MGYAWGPEADSWGIYTGMPNIAIATSDELRRIKELGKIME